MALKMLFDFKAIVVAEKKKSSESPCNISDFCSNILDTQKPALKKYLFSV